MQENKLMKKYVNKRAQKIKYTVMMKYKYEKIID